MSSGARDLLQDSIEMDYTDRQLDVMNVLWDRGSATVREARDEIEDDLAYTSVLTVFQTLEKHGKVRHEREGKAYRYYPTSSRREAGAEAVRYVLDRLFRGDPAKLVRALAAVLELPEERVEELEHILRDQEVAAE